MVERKQKASKGSATVVEATLRPKSIPIAESGIGTAKQFAGFMSALMADIVSGRIAPITGNAAVNAGGKLLKVVEMNHKYGQTSGGQGKKTLNLLD